MIPLSRIHKSCGDKFCDLLQTFSYKFMYFKTLRNHAIWESIDNLSSAVVCIFLVTQVILKINQYNLKLFEKIQDFYFIQLPIL